MVKPKAKNSIEIKNDLDEFTKELKDSINQNHKEKIAFDLGTEESPTNVKRFISSGSKLLNQILSMKTDGGFPEGRIVEIFGPPAIGKSHVAIQIARSVQQMGGVVIYADTENATSIQNLQMLGINFKRFLYVQPNCTEEVFQTAEEVIKKAAASNKSVPILFIWDSLAGTSPKEELLGDYDKSTIGLQARALSKGFRKITQVVGHNKVTFVCLNQTREKIGVSWGDPTTTPGGHAVKFHSSIRLKLSPAGQIKDKNDNIIGINVKATALKNKIVAPHRSCEFQIIFGVGIREDPQILEVLGKNGPEKIGDKTFQITTGTWNKLIIDGESIKSFRSSEFANIAKDYKEEFDELLEISLAKKFNTVIEIDNQSLEDVKSIQDLQRSQDM